MNKARGLYTWGVGVEGGRVDFVLKHKWKKGKIFNKMKKNKKKIPTNQPYLFRYESKTNRLSVFSPKFVVFFLN